ncbi:MAG: IPT/TIG domain-containing protein [Saprospiraceae bacterium]|nr:IPT/TIG domain-containing protein [Saprospiraceae bacterium]
MLNIINKIKIPVLISLLVIGFMLNSCDKDDDNTPSIQLLSFGPSPVLRGGDLRFIGTGLDKVTSIVLANNVEVNTFKTKTSELIVITVPEATVDGKVTLKTPQGNIETKTVLRISEPITITSISPARVRPGGILTISGTYLNLVKEVVFSAKKSVKAFQSQSQTKLEVKVPDDAQTGKIVLSNGEADPILVESETDVEVILPAASQISPNPVKAGSNLTIEGTDLDLVKTLVFGGGSRVTSFVSVESGKLVAIAPADARDGALTMIVASLVEVQTAQEVTMAVPSIANVSPNPAKNGKDITITGTDLDLVTTVVFGGNKQGAILSKSLSEMTVKVPVDATEGAVTFNTAANKSVATVSILSLVKPVIANIAPMETQANKEITISGTDLDLVAKVVFGGNKEVVVNNSNETELVVTVPPGTLSGAVILVAKNGDMITSASSLTILASNVPLITSIPPMIRPGEMITIQGEKLDLFVDVIFPDNIRATMFGIKTATMLQVLVPSNVRRGFGKIKFITNENETTESPEVNFQGVDPVSDRSLVFFDFDNLNRWWGDTGANENDPTYTLDGTNYFRVNGSLNGWTGFFWRNGKNEFPADAIGTNVSSYVLKFDVNVLDPITGGELAWRLKGSSGDFWYYWKPWEATGSYETNGWITVTIPLTEFKSGGDSISDLSTINEDFGVAFNNGASMVNACFDNVRFELK